MSIYNLNAEYGHSFSTLQPSVHRSVLPSGAFSDLKCVSVPNDEILVQGLPVSHNNKSISWQDLASIIGDDFAVSRQLPRT